MGKDFTPPVKGGFQADDAKHRRNWRALAEWLRSPFVTTGQIQDGAITSVKIEDATIDSAKIDSVSVDKLTGGTLSADVILGGSIATGSSPEQRVEIDDLGVRGYDEDNNNTVNIPTQGGAYFKGTVVADALELNGNTAIRSVGNLISTDAELRIASSGVLDPTTAPSLTWDPPELAQTGSLNPPGGRGAFYDSGTNRYYISNGLTVAWYNATTGASVGSKTFSIGSFVFGIVKSTNYWWVAIAVSAEPGVDFYLVRYDNADLSTNENVGPLIEEDLYHAYGLEWDSANSRLIVVADWRLTSTAYAPRIMWYDESRVLAKQLNSTSYNWRNNRGCFYDGSFLYIYDAGEAAAYTLNYATPSITASSANDIPLGVTDVYSLCDGKIYGVLAAPRTTEVWREYTTWNDATAYLHCRYTWYENGTGEETLGSSPASILYQARSRLKVSVGPNIPTGTDRIRVYVDESASATPPGQTSSEYKLQSTITVSPVTLDTWASGGAAIPTTNTTTGGTAPGLLVSDDGGFELFGDGTGAWPYLVPPGSIILYGGSTVPLGFLACDGSDVSRTTYADLFAAIGTIYGSGNGTTTFGLPAEGDLTASGLAQWIIKF